MFPEFWASSWSNLSVSMKIWLIWEFRKNQKIFVFEKKCMFFFFEVFVFWHFLAFFRRWKKWKFLCFFLKSKIRNTFKLKCWHEKLTNFNEYCFGASSILFQRLKFFLFFWVSCPTNLKKTNSENLKKIFQKCPTLKFHLWVCGQNFDRSAENSTKNILLTQILAKQF
jgi:hypothetical protein